MWFNSIIEKYIFPIKPLKYLPGGLPSAWQYASSSIAGATPATCTDKK